MQMLGPRPRSLPPPVALDIFIRSGGVVAREKPQIRKLVPSLLPSGHRRLAGADYCVARSVATSAQFNHCPGIPACQSSFDPDAIAALSLLAGTFQTRSESS